MTTKFATIYACGITILSSNNTMSLNNESVMDFPVFPDLLISNASCVRESIDNGFGKLLMDPIRSANAIHLINCNLGVIIQC